VTLPNFLIVGAPKAGTTSLYDGLRQHPDIFMSGLKEPRFFAYDGQRNSSKYPVKTLEDYEALFEGVRHEKAIGEASPAYFWSTDIPPRIRSLIPEARIIASLRDPVRRSFSLYCMNLRDRDTHAGVGFLEALHADRNLQRGYAEMLEAYFDCFGRRNVKVVLFEDIVERPLDVVQSLFAFLDVRADFVPSLTVSNPGGIPRFAPLHKLMSRSGLRLWARTHLPEPLVFALKEVRNLNLSKSRIQLAEQDARAARAFFESDILRTQALIGRDLSHWLAPAGDDGAGGHGTSGRRHRAASRPQPAGSEARVLVSDSSPSK
jgi:Sulfotransferase family